MRIAVGHQWATIRPAPRAATRSGRVITPTSHSTPKSLGARPHVAHHYGGDHGDEGEHRALHGRLVNEHDEQPEQDDRLGDSIGDGVEKPAEPGDLLRRPGQSAVHEVEQPRGEHDDARRPKLGSACQIGRGAGGRQTRQRNGVWRYAKPRQETRYRRLDQVGEGPAEPRSNQVTYPARVRSGHVPLSGAYPRHVILSGIPIHDLRGTNSRHVTLSGNEGSGVVGDLHLTQYAFTLGPGPHPRFFTPFKNDRGVCPYSHAQDRSSRDGPPRREARVVVVEHLAGYLFPPELLGPLATVYGEPVTQVGVP